MKTTSNLLPEEKQKNQLRQRDFGIGYQYTVGVCTKAVGQQKFASARGGPEFVIHINRDWRLRLERHHESPFVNHPFYAVLERRGFWGWYDVDRKREIICLQPTNHDKTVPRFLSRALRVLGTHWFNGICTDPSYFNLGALLGWYKRMEKDDCGCLTIDDSPQQWITKAAIEEHFLAMPNFDICSLNHQCTREEFERLREIASANQRSVCYA